VDWDGLGWIVMDWGGLDAMIWDALGWMGIDRNLWEWTGQTPYGLEWSGPSREQRRGRNMRNNQAATAMVLPLPCGSLIKSVVGGAGGATQFTYKTNSWG
jgi:hypothetical protein